MDNGLLRLFGLQLANCQGVLILIVMDNGLLLLGGGTPAGELKLRLNPYCNG